MTGAVLPAAARVLHRSRLLEPMLALATSRRRVASVLAYHRVNDDGDPFFPSLPSAVFEGHMAHVARWYTVLRVEELADRLRQGDVPRNALAITFDDGYRDNLTHAAPILTRLGVPATIFLATGLIGGAEAPWWDRLALAFKVSPAEALAAPWGARLPLRTQADRLRGLDQSLAYLKRLREHERRATLDAMLSALGPIEERSWKDLMLSWDDVHALMGLGWSVGAHTVSHPILSQVPAPEAWTEILGSRTMIESACGVAPRAFAYPNGRPEDYTETVERQVREAGFTCAVTTRFGVNTPATSPWELRRGGPWERDLPTFALKLAWYRIAGRR